MNFEENYAFKGKNLDKEIVLTYRRVASTTVVR